jgi:glycosyltransferase involved in cell wall biosynthesis
VKRHRIALVSETMAPYRLPVFNALAEIPEVDLHVLFLSSIDAARHPWSIDRTGLRFSWEVLPHWRRRIAGYHVLVNRGIGRALSRCFPDAVICGGYNYPASWSVLTWTRWHRVPLILWSESTGEDARRGHGVIEAIKRLFACACHGVVVPGRAARRYAQSLGVAAGHISEAPNAVDIDLFRAGADRARDRSSALRASLGLPDRYFVFVGRFAPEKRVSVLLDAYALLDPDVRAGVGLVLVGDGPLRAEFEQRVRTIQPGTVRFAGFVQTSDLAPYYALSIASVLPSASDVWGLVVNEAMACGTPAIVSAAVGCAPDLIEPGVSGYIVPPDDARSLASALHELAARPDLAGAMGARGLARIQRFSPAACAAGLAGSACAAIARHESGRSPFRARGRPVLLQSNRRSCRDHR